MFLYTKRKGRNSFHDTVSQEQTARSFSVPFGSDMILLLGLCQRETSYQEALIVMD
jgi:hypothetical protein